MAAHMNNIMIKLRKMSMPVHRTLNNLPYVKALMSHQLPLSSYVNALRALAVIHSVLEEEINQSENEIVRSVWSADLKKFPLLQRDLDFFAPRAIADAVPALDAAVEVTKNIRRIRLTNSVALLGYLYVFEGTTLGHKLHTPDISKIFCLTRLDGYRYVNSYGEDVDRHWQEFSTKMNRALSDSSEHEAILDTSRELFLGLKEIYTQLYPVESSAFSTHVTRINPEAGTHPIPENKDEIKAALSASQRAWHAFPYYDVRYGERGRRFSDSDTCWLVTLTRLDEESCNRQISWIGRMLAGRGMPSVMLEETLRYLEEELNGLVPQDGTSYALLGQAANSLRNARQKVLSDRDAQTLITEFEKATDNFSSSIPRVGELLVCAVADEANGMENAVASLSGWIAEQERFDADWCAAVNATLQAASAAIHS